jgi:predicted transcriptional regulator
VSDILGIELNNASTRLINLHRQRLVTRRERVMAEGGREFVYAGLKEETERVAR